MIDGSGLGRATLIFSAIGLLALACMHFGGPGPQDLGWVMRPAHIVTTSIALAILLVTNYCFGRLWPTEQRVAGNKFLVFSVLTLAVFAEELFFRGVLQNRYGIVVASLAFAFLHPTSIAYFALAAISGFVFGAVYFVTDSFPAALLTHLVHNWIVFFTISKGTHENANDLGDSCASYPSGV